MVIDNPYRPFTILGILLVLIGVILIALPLIAKHTPTLESLEKLPPILVWVYRKGNFYFITSPILIILSILSLLIFLITRAPR